MGLSELGPGASRQRPAAVFDFEILDDATGPGQEVRCRHRDDPTRATDPMPFTPYTITAEGTWYPKRGERAIVLEPVNGPPVITDWWPAAGRVPDVFA